MDGGGWIQANEFGFIQFSSSTWGEKLVISSEISSKNRDRIMQISVKINWFEIDISAHINAWSN